MFIYRNKKTGNKVFLFQVSPKNSLLDRVWYEAIPYVEGERSEHKIGVRLEDYEVISSYDYRFEAI